MHRGTSAPALDAGLALGNEVTRLSRALHGQSDPRAINELVNRELVHRCLGLLTDPAFGSLDFRRRQEALETVYRVFLESGNANAPLVARAAGRAFRQNLRDPSATVFDHVAVYTWLYGLYWIGASDLAGMSRFDGDVVKPFWRYLERQESARQAVGRGKRPIAATGPLRTCYLAHYAHFERGNAIGPIVASLARAHAALESPEHEVFVYCVEWYQDDFLRALDNSGVTVRTFRVTDDLGQLDVVRQAFADDHIDAAITDVSSGVATYLFAHRVAPLQLWLEMGYPYWSIDALDWTFLCHKDYRGDFGIDPHRCSPLRLRQARDTLDAPHDGAEVERARAAFPADAFVLGTFARFTKVTPDFLALIERALESEPRLHFVLGGGGDPTLVLDFLRETPVASRVHVHHDCVDVNVHGRAIDAFIDTFPHCGGNSCREVMSFGKPVVSFRSGDWGRLVAESRDPELVAENADAHVEIVLRLAREPSFLAVKSARALEIAGEETDVRLTVQDVADRLERLRSERAPQGAAECGQHAS